MSSVQAVITALNQQNNQTDTRQQQQPSNRQSIRDRFGTSPNATIDLKTHRSSHMEKRSTSNTTNTNRPSSSFVPLRHDSLVGSAARTKMNHQQATKQQLVEKLEKMNAEINQLKQQLHGKSIDTPDSRACELPETEMPTLPPACFIWFDVDGDMTDHNSTESNHLSSPDMEYDDIIADYNRHIFTQGQQQQHINALQRQMAACEIGTQWMMNKYLGELELERLRTRSLDTIVQSQEDLINIMETKGIESVEQSHQQQQTFLLQSQLELQRMELDDKQEIMTLMADERDILVKKIKRLTQQLHQQQYYINPSPSQQNCIAEQTERRSKNHPRTVSTSSTCSTSSYNTTLSSTSMSCVDWANINGMHQHSSSTYLLSSFSKPPPINATANMYSPPQTPPPREKLPPLPTSSSASSTITTPNLSPRSTVLSATPSLSSSLATLESSTSSSSLDYQGALTHQHSMPDIRSHQDHRRATHHYRRDSGDPTLCSPPGGLEKGSMRQKSFWKGWRQRLSS